jgi:dihydrofolate reductase
VKRYPETVPAHLRQPIGVRPASNWVDTVLMGRKTYDVGLPFGVKSPYPHLKQYVFSRSMTESPSPDVILVRSDPLEYVRKLKREKGRDIWLCGGGVLAAALFPEIDELILKVNPVILGSGIAMFEGPVPQTDVDLVESQTYPNGFVLKRYRMRR